MGLIQNYRGDLQKFGFDESQRCKYIVLLMKLFKSITTHLYPLKPRYGIFILPHNVQSSEDIQDIRPKSNFSGNIILEYYYVTTPIFTL